MVSPPVVSRVARADRAQQRLGVVAEERDQDELLLARRKPLGLLAHVLGRGRVVFQRHAVGEERDRPLDGRVDRAGRPAEAALDECPKLVDDRAVAASGENVDQRLRGEDLPDRGRERRPAGLAADRLELLERLEQPVAGGVGAQVGVERRDEPGRQVVLRCPHRQPRRVRRHDLVADVLVDEVRCLPQTGDVDASVEPHPGQRGRERLAGDPMEGERERIDRAGDQIGAGARRLERVGEAATARSLAVEADGQARGLLDPSDELGGLVRLEPAARIVHEGTRCLDVGQLLRLFDELRPSRPGHRGCTRGRRGTPCPRRRSPRRDRAGSRRR